MRNDILRRLNVDILTMISRYTHKYNTKAVNKELLMLLKPSISVIGAVKLRNLFFMMDRCYGADGWCSWRRAHGAKIIRKIAKEGGKLRINPTEWNLPKNY